MAASWWDRCGDWKLEQYCGSVVIIELIDGSDGYFTPLLHRHYISTVSCSPPLGLVSCYQDTGPSLCVLLCPSAFCSTVDNAAFYMSTVITQRCSGVLSVYGA